MESERVKRCARCGGCKPHREFAPRRANLDGLQRHCRDCGAESHSKRAAAMGRQPRLTVQEGHKHCLGCGEVKPHSEWHRNGSAVDGLATRCKACRVVDGRVGHLKRAYGITEAERDEMVAAQGGLCCICLKAPAVHVDHCHETGRVRGVLCFNCNSAIGKLGDDPDILRRAISYLEGNAWKPIIVAQGVYRQPS
nr:endonuclease VII domain-containing protein [Streptomyces sp. KS 21]